MAYETIIVEIEDSVALIRLNRPEALNALNTALIRELGHALTEADRNTLRQKAAARGVDGAFSDHEFTTPGDNSSYEIDMEGAEA